VCHGVEEDLNVRTVASGQSEKKCSPVVGITAPSS
jgi:hypothetical protein